MGQQHRKIGILLHFWAPVAPTDHIQIIRWTVVVVQPNFWRGFGSFWKIVAQWAQKWSKWPKMVVFGTFLTKIRKKIGKNVKWRKIPQTPVKLSTTRSPNPLKTMKIPMRPHEAWAIDFFKICLFWALKLAKWGQFWPISENFVRIRVENQSNGWKKWQIPYANEAVSSVIHKSNTLKHRCLFRIFDRFWGFGHVLPPSGSLCPPQA